MLGDLQDPRLMYAKAVGFLLIALLAGGLLIAESASLRTAALLALTIWSSARVYYFCFYVIERYIDPSFRFDGLVSVVRYLLTRRGRSAAPRTPS